MEEDLKESIKEKAKPRTNVATKAKSKKSSKAKPKTKTNSATKAKTSSTTKVKSKTSSKGSSTVKPTKKTTQKSKTNTKSTATRGKKVKEELKEVKKATSKTKTTSKAKANSTIRTKPKTSAKSTTKSKASPKTKSKTNIKQKESIKEEPLKEQKVEIKENKKEKIVTNTADRKKTLHKVINVVVILLFVICLLYKHGFFSKLEIKYFKSGLSIQKIDLENNNINIELTPSMINKDRWCQILSEDGEVDDAGWIKVTNNLCVCNIQDDMKYILVKDEKNISQKIKIEDYLNAITYLNTEKEKIIIVKGEEKKIEVDVKYIGNPDLTLFYSSENEEILKTKDKVLEGIEAGETSLTITDRYNHILIIPVIVTDLVTTPQLNESKAFLKAGQYTQEEAHIIDEILEERVKEAGLKTRAGVVAAARFITLEFKYRVPYFLENGRFQKTGFSEQIDGEGRYYHKGLYLTKDKFETIKRSKRKPATWGETLYEYSNSRYMKNGLDCSGFVSWALYNGGYDPGDIGAGPNASFITMPDLGVSQKITLNLLKSGKVRAGDLIGWNGHIGVIIGIDDEYIYTADTVYYQKGLVATKYTLEEMAKKSHFTHIYDMSEYYVDDGNYTNMW